MNAFTTEIILFVLLLLKESGMVNGIGCFTCNSINGSDENCRDPFSPAHVTFERKCKQGMDGRVGLFPAKYCIKIKGTNQDTKSEMLIRSCGMKPMDNTCGPFEFKNHKYYGCLMSCRKEACNKGCALVPMTSLISVLLSSMYVLCGRS